MHQHCTVVDSTAHCTKDVKTMLKTNIVIRIMSVKMKQKIELDWSETTYDLCIIPVIYLIV